MTLNAATVTFLLLRICIGRDIFFWWQSDILATNLIPTACRCLDEDVGNMRMEAVYLAPLALAITLEVVGKRSEDEKKQRPGNGELSEVYGERVCWVSPGILPAGKEKIRKKKAL